MTKKQQVLDRLGDGEWHTSDEIREVGGSSALRRLRELRDEGHEVEKRRIGGNVFEYRLVREDEDWFHTCSCFWKESDNSARLIRIDPDCIHLPHPGVVRY